MREYFVFYTQRLNLKIVDCFERDETKEEKLKRKLTEESQITNVQESQKIDLIPNKNVAKTGILKPNKSALKPKQPEKKFSNDNLSNLQAPQKVFEVRPNNINMKSGYCLYFKWIASQLQTIKDLKITDSYVMINI